MSMCVYAHNNIEEIDVRLELRHTTKRKQPELKCEAVSTKVKESRETLQRKGGGDNDDCTFN